LRQLAEVETTSPAERLRHLVDVTRMFAERAADPALLRRTIAEQAGRLLGGYCLLGLISSDRRSWHLVGEFSPHPEHANELRRAMGGLQTDIDGPTVTATVARTGRPVIIDDMCTDAWRARLDPDLWEIVERFEQRGAICVPLRAHQEVIGTIAVGRMGNRALRFDDADVALLQVLADHATQTILHSRSLESMQRELADHRCTRESLRRTEEGLLQAAKMEALGQLAGGVAHDFNNILSVIVGYSELLLSGGSYARGDIEEIHRASLRGSSLTSQLLAFSRKEPLLPRAIDINQIVAGMRPMLQLLLGEQVELHIAAGAGLPACHLDPSQAEQILMNLVINARDAMPKGGQLTIETARAVLDDEYAAAHAGTTPGPHVMLSVTDTGVGMPDDVRARIFEPLFTTKPRGIGTGLGLATVHGIVKQSGGNISVYSEPGRGTTFRLQFPVASPALPAPTGEAEPDITQQRGSGNVLVVEDDADVRTLVCRVLKRAGYEALEASSEAEAERLCLLHEDMKLLITDVVLPRTSGQQIARRLQKLRPGLNVLYISGYGERAIANHGVLEPGMPFVQKPILPSALLRRVHSLLSDDRCPVE
jgi:signal transduction histidine kinase/CheY-like chemotaxis protein